MFPRMPAPWRQSCIIYERMRKKIKSKTRLDNKEVSNKTIKRHRACMDRFQEINFMKSGVYISGGGEVFNVHRTMMLFQFRMSVEMCILRVIIIWELDYIIHSRSVRCTSYIFTPFIHAFIRTLYSKKGKANKVSHKTLEVINDHIFNEKSHFAHAKKRIVCWRITKLKHNFVVLIKTIQYIYIWSFYYTPIIIMKINAPVAL